MEQPDDPYISGNRRAPSKPTIHSIQALRAIAALLVVLFHSQSAFTRQVSVPLFDAERYVFGFGAVGVHIFFVISGFIMVASSRFDGNFSTRVFFRRRLLRIYPVYWFCCGLYLLVHALIGQPYTLSAREFAGAFLLLPGDAPKIIGPAWTLAYELYFYFCFGLAMIAGLSRGLLLLAGLFFLSITLGILFHFESAFPEVMTNPLLLEFLGGTLTGWLAKTGRLPRRGGTALILLSLFLFGTGLLLGYERLPSLIMWGIPSVLLIMGAVIHETAGRSPSWVYRLGALGDSSYMLYLIHILIITLAVQTVRAVPFLSRPEPAVAALIIAIMAQIIAQLLHNRIERPMMARLNRK